MSRTIAQPLKQSASHHNQFSVALDSTAGVKAASGSFLHDLRIEHGPLELLGRFFLRADEAVRTRGVTLAFADLSELRTVNENNQDSWTTLMPMFHADAHKFEPNRSLCILGYNADGDVVATQAARVYDLREANLKRAAEDLSLFYGSAKVPTRAICQITASSAECISGLVTYSGCGWYRPDYRGRLLSTILPRISRALALALWNAQYTVSFVNRTLVKKGVADRYGYRNIDDGVFMSGIIEADFPVALVWMHREQLLDDLNAYLGTESPEVNVGARRGGDQKLFSLGIGKR